MHTRTADTARSKGEITGLFFKHNKGSNLYKLLIRFGKALLQENLNLETAFANQTKLLSIASSCQELDYQTLKILHNLITVILKCSTVLLVSLSCLNVDNSVFRTGKEQTKCSAMIRCSDYCKKQVLCFTIKVQLTQFAVKES